MMNKRMFLGTAAAVALFAASFAVPAFATDPDAALKDLMTKVNSKGPNGEDPALGIQRHLDGRRIGQDQGHECHGRIGFSHMAAMIGPTPRPLH